MVYAAEIKCKAGHQLAAMLGEYESLQDARILVPRLKLHIWEAVGRKLHPPYCPLCGEGFAAPTLEVTQYATIQEASVLAEGAEHVEIIGKAQMKAGDN